MVAEAEEWWSSRLDVAEDICIVFVLYLLTKILSKNINLFSWVSH